MGNKKVSTAIKKDILPRCIGVANGIFDAEIQRAIEEVPFTTIGKAKSRADLLLKESNLLCASPSLWDSWANYNYQKLLFERIERKLGNEPLQDKHFREARSAQPAGGHSIRLAERATETRRRLTGTGSGWARFDWRLIDRRPRTSRRNQDSNSAG